MIFAFIFFVLYVHITSSSMDFYVLLTYGLSEINILIKLTYLQYIGELC